MAGRNYFFPSSMYASRQLPQQHSTIESLHAFLFELLTWLSFETTRLFIHFHNFLRHGFFITS